MEALAGEIILQKRLESSTCNIIVRKTALTFTIDKLEALGERTPQPDAQVQLSWGNTLCPCRGRI